MKKTSLLKIAAVLSVLAIGFAGFLFTRKSETQTRTPEPIIDAKSEVANYKSWTKVNNKPEFMASDISKMCARPTKEQIAAKPNPHTDHFINVYVNSIGKNEMLSKKNPVFPVGTIVVKEKLPSPTGTAPELLTVMIKREIGFNREVGDWEFLTFSGDATEITSRGKLMSCQTCHLGYAQTDYITRTYLPGEIRQKLK